MKPPWMEVAEKYLHKGVKEIPGLKDDPDILAFLESCRLGIKLHDEIPWCGAFVNACLEEVGIKGVKGPASAASWKDWGEEMEDCQQEEGAVTLVSRDGGSGYHVGFYDSEDRIGVWVLGGNQNDMVCVKRFPWSRITNFRWMKEG